MSLLLSFMLQLAPSGLLSDLRRWGLRHQAAEEGLLQPHWLCWGQHAGLLRGSPRAACTDSAPSPGQLWEGELGISLPL